MTKSQALTILRELDRLVEVFEGHIEDWDEAQQHRALDALEHYADVQCIEYDEAKKRHKEEN